MTTDLVAWLPEAYWRHRFTPEGLRSHLETMVEVARIEEGVRRIQAGEATREEVFGPLDNFDNFVQRFYDEHPDLPRRYRLPKGWHWMGEVSDGDA